MAGSPKKRAAKELAAKKRLEILAREQADEKARNIPRRPRYTQKLAKEICGFIASGIPIEDIVLNGAVIAPGVAKRVGIGSRTFWDWKQRHKNFAADIDRARAESGHRIADRMAGLAEVALSEPAMANAVKVAADIMRWQAQVRNPGSYGERHKLDVKADVSVHEDVSPEQVARRFVFMLHKTAVKADLPEFIETQVFALRLVADQVRTRGGGSSKPGMHEGRYAELARTIEQFAEAVGNRLRNDGLPQSPKALPAPSEPQGIARAREEADEEMF